MPLQNGGGWALEAQAQQAMKQPAAARRGRRGATLLLLLRVGALCASAAAAALAAAATPGARRSGSCWRPTPSWRCTRRPEAAAAAWEVAGGATLLPEAMQLWFDFAHDQVVAAGEISRMDRSDAVLNDRIRIIFHHCLCCARQTLWLFGHTLTLSIAPLTIRSHAPHVDCVFRVSRNRPTEETHSPGWKEEE
ncbi:unnamed protein product [Miscanthus lutarioriparius]|uniref:Uncharacterized protein n=1 Tax=Miscanthus lutarioriparius TaxID=422564 RepID=A0A811SIF8_9POAL|nr:unnamed protein product [Miscanthus lutarioriparius]